MLQTMKKGFTLIELLVVITIIGILATGAVTVYTSQIQKARDTTRISSVKGLQSGVEQFYQDVSEYPVGTNGWLNGGQAGSNTSVNDYVPNLAEDPKHDNTCNGSRCGYVYNAGSDSNGITNGAYEISTAFENQGNVDNKAARDDGEDGARLELGILKTGTAGNDIVTLSAQGTAFAGATPVLGVSEVPLVIRSGEVRKK